MRPVRPRTSARRASCATPRKPSPSFVPARRASEATWAATVRPTLRRGTHCSSGPRSRLTELWNDLQPAPKSGSAHSGSRARFQRACHPRGAAASARTGHPSCACTPRTRLSERRVAVGLRSRPHLTPRRGALNGPSERFRPARSARHASPWRGFWAGSASAAFHTTRPERSLAAGRCVPSWVL